VAVTGATGGVGSVAVEILAKIGYHVVAITGKPEEARYLRALGAKEVLQRQAIELGKIRPLDKSTWAGAIDNLGGDMLAWLLSTMKIGGTASAVGLAAGRGLGFRVGRRDARLGARAARLFQPLGPSQRLLQARVLGRDGGPALAFHDGRGGCRRHRAVGAVIGARRRRGRVRGCDRGLAPHDGQPTL
jgi:hypothetical protein